MEGIVKKILREQFGGNIDEFKDLAGDIFCV